MRPGGLRFKLVLALVSVGALAVAVTGWEGYRRARSALEAAAVNQLTSVREERRRAMESYFAQLRLETATLAESRLIGDAMRRFAAAFADLERRVTDIPPSLIAEYREGIARVHRERLAPHLDHGEGTSLTEAVLVPRDTAALVLQVLYVLAEPARPEAGTAVDRQQAARYAGPYAEAVASLDPPLRRLVGRLGVHDIYLIDQETGRIVYTIEREADLGTSLLTGPYRDTGLASAFRQAREAPDATAVTLVDFEHYVPSESEPNAFMAAPILVGGERLGVLAVELAVAPLDRLMTGGGSWRAGGLGRTGETYLVGPDHRMRTNSRFMVEAPEDYLRVLARRGVPERVRQLIARHRSTILFERVESAAANAALAGSAATGIGADYRGVPVITAYAPVDVPGVHWGIVAQIDVAEALAPAVALRTEAAVTGVVIALLVGALALVLGTGLTRPLLRLMDGMRRLGRGNLDHRVAVGRRDEVGQIAAAFNQMADDLQETTVSRDYVSSILTSMNDAVIVVRPPADGDWREAVVVTANPSACALIDQPEEAILGQRIGELIPEIATPGQGSRRAALWLEEVVRLGNIAGREVVYRIVDGRDVPVLFSSALMPGSASGTGGVVWAAHNLTELKQLEARNAFIRDTFGRYVSDDVVAALLGAPEALRLGGEARTVTIMITDLRGFTALAGRLDPEEVVAYLNDYFERMVELILRYRGTINEIMGDGILVIFGAPTSAADDAERAVACALAMQIAMREFSSERCARGLLTAEMGIGLHTGQVIVGNIGSARRAKYTVVGTPVNLASRIESYTTGGQVLISEDTRRAVSAELTVQGQLRIEPKGARESLAVHDVVGIGAPHDLALGSIEDVPVAPDVAIPVRFAVLEEKHVGRSVFPGRLLRLSRRGAEIAAAQAVEPLSNVKIWLLDERGADRAGELYAKVVGDIAGGFRVRFTSVAPEVSAEIEERLARPGP